MLAADIGAGTGRLTALLLDAGLEVICIEPDPSMRAYAGAHFAGEPRVRIVAGTAEQTGLANQSADIVTAGQAFHWFDPAAALPEFKRILRPPKKLLTIDNRPAEGSLWLLIRDALRRFDIHSGYVDAHRRNPDAAREKYFKEVTKISMEFVVTQDLKELERRVQSQSTKPLPGQPGHAAMLEALRHIFEKHQEEGHVHLRYEAAVYYGTI